MNPSLRMILLAVGLFLVLAVMAGLYEFYRRASAAPPPDPIVQVLTRAETAWAATLLAFDQGAYEEAANCFLEDVVSPVGSVLERNPEAMAETGLSLEEWLIRKDSLYRERAGQVMETLFSGLADGTVNPLQVHAWLDRHAYPEWDMIGSAREETLLAERSRAATNWFRVFLEEEQTFPGLRAKVEEMYRRKWPAEGAPQLVFGPALSAEEQALTRNTIAVSSTLGYASFKVSVQSVFSGEDWEPPDVPILLTLSNRVVGGTGPAGTWDRAGPFHAYIKPPRGITRRYAHPIIANYRNLLLQEIEQALDELPAYREKESQP